MRLTSRLLYKYLMRDKIINGNNKQKRITSDRIFSAVSDNLILIGHARYYKR